MTNEKNNRSLFDRFALRGIRGLVGLVAVAILAFSFGVLFSSGGQPVTDSLDHSQTAKADNPTVWICSMHPQIQLPKPGKCPICFMDLIPLETGHGDDVGPRQLRMSETAKSLARIQTTVAKRAFAEAEVRMVGKVTYDETRLSYITAWVPGRLDRLYADFTGMTVKKGDHMVYMYSPELLAAQEELLQAKSAVQSLARSTSTILKSSADATLDATREKLRLYGLSANQIEEIETNRTPSDHVTINAPIGGVVIHKNAQEGMYVKTGTRIYTIADLTKLWVTFEAYESDLPWLRYGQQVSFTSPSFPGESFDAVISFIDPVVNPGTRTVQVRTIVENSGLKLKPGMFVRGFVESRIDGAGRVIDDYLVGKWISPMHPEVVKDGPGTCDVCGMDLVPAESLGYASEAQTDADAPLLIPASAPMITGKRAVVYVEIPNDEGPLYEGREVQLGPRAGDFYVVKSGIEEGELVVTNGAFKIDSELQIQAKPSMMSPDGGATTAGHQHGQPGSGATKPSHVVSSATTETESNEAAAALTPVYNAYFDTQMALAADDLAAATRAGEQVETVVGRVDMSHFSRTGHGKWMSLSGEIADFAADMNVAGDIEEARRLFLGLSKSVIELHDSFGHADSEDYFLTFCPMANDNKGAYWLQTVDTVYNSFYGASMLRCGEIKKKLPGRTGSPPDGGGIASLTGLYRAYFVLQRALTFNNLQEIHDAHNRLAEAASSIASSLTDQQSAGPIADWATNLIRLSRAGANSPDVAAARVAFLPVAQTLIDLHDAYGHQRVYHRYQGGFYRLSIKLARRDIAPHPQCQRAVDVVAVALYRVLERYHPHGYSVHRAVYHHPTQRNDVMRFIPGVDADNESEHNGQYYGRTDDDAAGGVYHRLPQRFVGAAQGVVSGDERHYHEREQYYVPFVETEYPFEDVTGGDKLYEGANGADSQVLRQRQAINNTDDDDYRKQPQRNQHVPNGYVKKAHLIKSPLRKPGPLRFSGR